MQKNVLDVSTLRDVHEEQIPQESLGAAPGPKLTDLLER
jgi:hypothetical protein